jgi:hypothetical protein
MYWSCDRPAGSTVFRWSTSFVGEGATVSATFQPDGGRWVTRSINPGQQLSTPLGQDQSHRWTIVWAHEPGTITTTVNIVIEPEYCQTSYLPPPVDIAIRRESNG